GFILKNAAAIHAHFDRWASNRYQNISTTKSVNAILKCHLLVQGRNDTFLKRHLMSVGYFHFVADVPIACTSER
ncbi:TPA: hypothetical protein ACGZAA_005247, partial [Klebsiella pneumoniae]